MGPFGYLDDYPLPLIFVVSLVVILGASEIGRRIGLHARGQGNENLSTLEGAIFGLLALMIGFTFAVALARFEERRDAVLTEANAIGTAALRVRMLPPPYDAEALKLLREYMQLRVSAAQRPPSEAELNAGIAHSNELQEALWQKAMAGVAARSSSLPNWLVFDAINQVANGQRKRLAVFHNQVPNEIVVVLYVIAAIAIGFAGYAEGLRARPSRLPIYLTGLLICAVILLIVDLDSPFTGVISVSQQPLIDTAALLEGY